MALDGAAGVVEGHFVWGPVVLWRTSEKVCHMQRKPLVVGRGGVFGSWDSNPVCVSEKSHFGC